MKIAIFGTGTYYRRYKSYINENDIICLIDNDENKQGTFIDGKAIYDPCDVDYFRCDYVLILAKKYNEIKEQLVTLGVPLGKIACHFDIGEIIAKKVSVESMLGDILLTQWNMYNKGKKIMLISHDLTRTGVPIALMNLAILLKKMGYAVLYAAAQSGGKLSDELLENDIDFMTGISIFINNHEFAEEIKHFDLLIFGTVVISDIVPYFCTHNKSIMWWIHESDRNLFEKNQLTENMISEIAFFAGGRRPRLTVENFFNINSVKELLYYLPDKKVLDKWERDNAKIRFALIGTFARRKGQDVLAKAALLIPEKYNGKYEIVMVGSAINDEIEYCLDIKSNYTNIKYLDSCTQKELDEFYETVDVLICPSRDDAMPLVVAQAMQYGIACIVSDQVGQAEFIIQGVNGFVFPNEDIWQLASIMTQIIQNPEGMKLIGEKGKLVFNKHFSESNMKNKMIEILNKGEKA